MPAEQTARARNTKARDLEALDLRAQGHTLQTIADLMGYADRSSAKRAVDRAATQLERARENLEARRRVELEKLDRLDEVIAARVAEGDLAAIDRALRIQTRRAILLGLNPGAGYTGREQNTPTNASDRPDAPARPTPANGLVHRLREQRDKRRRR